MEMRRESWGWPGLPTCLRGAVLVMSALLQRKLRRRRGGRSRENGKDKVRREFIA